MVFRKKPPSRKLTVPVLETIRPDRFRVYPNFWHEVGRERRLSVPNHVRGAPPLPQSPPSPPPAIWQWNKENGGQFASINRPIAGATHDKELPVGKHPLQLYSLGTPNGVKVTVMLEELLALGHSGAEYDAWLIRINEGEQFGSGFVSVNPNSKIPALLDRTDPANPVRVFES